MSEESQPNDPTTDWEAFGALLRAHERAVRAEKDLEEARATVAARYMQAGARVLATEGAKAGSVMEVEHASASIFLQPSQGDGLFQEEVVITIIAIGPSVEQSDGRRVACTHKKRMIETL